MPVKLKQFKNICIGLFLIVVNFISISGSIHNSIALPAGDDGILSHVYASINPEKFRLDQIATIFNIETSTSIINWLPYKFYVWFEINPVFFWYLFLIIQTSILPISIFLLFKYLLRNLSVAVLFTIITINIRPQMLNLTYSGDLEWMPYAGWLSLGFSLLALYFYLNNSLDLAYGLILIVSLIHPIFGIWLLLTFIIATKMSKIYSTQSRNVKFRLWLFASCIVLNLFRLYINYLENSAQAIPTNYIRQIKNNAHFNALMLYQVPIEQYFVTNASILSILGFLLFMLSNFATLHKFFDSRFKVFISSAIIALVIGLVTQLVGIYTNNLTLIRLLGIRLSGLLSVLFFVIFLVGIFHKNPKLNYKTFILISGLLIFPGAGLFFFVGVSSFWINYRQCSKKIKIAGTALILVGICSSFRLFTNLYWNTINNLTDFDMAVSYLVDTHLFVRNYFIDFIPKIFIPVVLIFFLACLHLASIKHHSLSFFWESKKLMSILCVVLFLFFSFGRYSNSIDRFTLFDKDFVKVQSWVRINTNENSTFYIQTSKPTYAGWRNFTNRPKINIVPEPYPYAYYKSDSNFELQYASYIREFGFNKLINPDFNFLRINSSRFGIDYVVCDRAFITENANVVFMNQFFKVIKL